jgi:type IV pilus assembly protein PilN
MIAAAVVVLILLSEAGIWYGFHTSILDLKARKTAAERELVVLKKKVQEVENFEKDKKVYEERIGIIQTLKKNQRGPVRILDRISQELPNKVWLTSLVQNGDGITLEGMAIANEDLVQYVNNLKQSRLFTDVQLIESRQAAEGTVAVYKFQLTFKINMDLI